MCVTRSWRLLTREPKLPTGPPIGGDAIVAVDAGIVDAGDDGAVLGRSACFEGESVWSKNGQQGGVSAVVAAVLGGGGALAVVFNALSRLSSS